ncbi:hypothetical protein F4604DRAFT_1929062 [Suillus subluteus]|nr:hypothetical protein F4604DRAFT_1929062 [Suillus subluteus]
MSSEWTTTFKSILDLHHKDVIYAKSKSAQRLVVKKVRKAILAAYEEQEEDVPLPTSLTKGIKQYYIQDKEEADEREAASRPREASFYKKTLSEWDVAQKLFKQEIDQYDKSEQQRKGLERSIKYRTGHARQWFDNMTFSQEEQVKLAMKKWNKEGAPEESQASYRKNNLKKTLEDFSMQIQRTMGCRVVMLVSHKKKASQTLSVSLHESEPQNAKKRFSISSSGIKEWTSTGFESFAEWSKTEFYPSGDEDHAGSDNEDDENGPVIPEVILDDDGYAKLPTRDGIGLKGQHELIRNIFHASYKVCTGGSRPVPWGTITANSSNYLEPDSVPTGFVVKDPSHMKTEEVNCLWNHWERQSAAGQKLVRFIKAKDSDVRANIHNEERKRKSKEKRVRRLESDEEDQDQPDSLNDSNSTERRVQPAEAETTPDDVSINDRYTFLESLCKHDNYLELIDAIRDLAILANQKPSSEQHADLPTWADWSWGGSYLPEDVHTSYDVLKASLNKLRTFVISGAPSAMPVVLGIGLLYRESKRVIEFEEDEAASNTPSYLPGSVFDLQFLVALDHTVQEVLSKIVEHIERLTKEALDEDDDIQDEGEVGNKETEIEVDQQEQDWEQEQEQEPEPEQDQDQDQDQEEVDEVVQKGTKRRKSQASTSKSKKPRMEPEVRRSSRARQPSKRAQM